MNYSVGIDFGTLSARAVLVNLTCGSEVASAEYVYPHAVMETALPSGKKLEKNFALQHPADYLEALKSVIDALICKTGVKNTDIKGVGIDFTSCTVLPVDENGTPLCFKKEFEDEPHAYAKLWKHHGAENEADAVTLAAAECGEPFLTAYGGRVNSEMILPKILETYNKAPHVYKAASYFVEAGDWIVWQLTGRNVRNSCMAGFKSCWTAEDGMPSDKFFEKIGVDMREKLCKEIVTTGTFAGCVNIGGAHISGLYEGCAVAAPIIDAHAALPAAGITDNGKLMLIIGTSGCQIVQVKERIDIDGIVGRVYGGVTEGLYAYEAGQTGVGDIFAWFTDNAVPTEYKKEADEKGISLHTLLSEKAAKYAVGESGLVALDWWNGCRSPYGDFSLRGCIFGLSLATKPEEIYRALIEATAYGTKCIVDMYEKGGLVIDEVYATGGISKKNPFLMQIYADVIGKEIKVSDNSASYGSALLGARAAGADKKYAFKTAAIYTPDKANTEKYETIYKKYLRLAEFIKEI